MIYVISILLNINALHSDPSLVVFALLLDDASQMSEPLIVQIVATIGFMQRIWQLAGIADAFSHQSLHLCYSLVHKALESFYSCFAP